jgi:hypothetical protein
MTVLTSTPVYDAFLVQKKSLTLVGPWIQTLIKRLLPARRGRLLRRFLSFKTAPT